MERITAIFEKMDDAEASLNELRREGIAEDQISIVTRHPDADHQGAWKTAAKGAGMGAGAGAILGIAAAFIPGAGPFITAGVLTSWLGAVAGSAASGAVVGGAAGALSGALQRAGYEKEAADAYGREIESGRVLLAVDLRQAQRAEDVLATLARHNGRTHEMHVPG